MKPKFAKQQTIKNPITFEGIGVHTGKIVKVTLHPGEVNSGIIFKRIDCPTPHDIPARWDYVMDTQLCTKIGLSEDISVGTIEHLLSACSGCGIDNLIIEINGPEVPIFDGSSGPFIKFFDRCGISKQNAFRKIIRIKKQITIAKDDVFVKLSPSPEFSIKIEIDFSSPAIGKQILEKAITPHTYKRLIANARTFGFQYQVEELHKIGLAKGASLENAIAIDQHDKIMNVEGLRYQDEFVRHKMLDTIGDLYLCGHPLLGQFQGIKNGHAINFHLIKSLMEDTSSWEYVHIPEASIILSPSYQPLPSSLQEDCI